MVIGFDILTNISKVTKFFYLLLPLPTRFFPRILKLRHRNKCARSQRGRTIIIFCVRTLTIFNLLFSPVYVVKCVLTIRSVEKKSVDRWPVIPLLFLSPGQKSPQRENKDLSIHGENTVEVDNSPHIDYRIEIIVCIRRISFYETTRNFVHSQ